MASTEGSRKPTRHKRSTTGCITCRIRRVKCDEQKPCCTRCTSTGRNCDGYPAPVLKTGQPGALVVFASPISLACSRPSACAEQSRRSFHLFSELYAPMLSGYGTAGFWNMVVLQASNINESIKHLVIAASNLQPLPYPSAIQGSNIAFLAHYGRALKLLYLDQNSDTIAILIACILLSLCDELQGRRQNAQQHIQAGQRILATDRGLHSSPWIGSVALNEIVSTFSRLNTPRPVIGGLLKQ